MIFGILFYALGTVELARIYVANASIGIKYIQSQFIPSRRVDFIKNL